MILCLDSRLVQRYSIGTELWDREIWHLGHSMGPSKNLHLGFNSQLLLVI